MPVQLVTATPSAYAFPLLIKHLLHSALTQHPDQEIVYRDKVRHTYRDLEQRIGRLANGLAGLGVEAGKTVAIMTPMTMENAAARPITPSSRIMLLW